MIAPVAKVFQLKWPDIFTKGHGSATFRIGQVLQHQAGYNVSDSILNTNPNAGYYGNPQKYLFRITYQYADRISLGFAGEKDPGEQFFRGSQKAGMDYYSGYLCLKNQGILKSLVIGNFKVDFGQGLTMSGGAGYGSLISSGILRRVGRGIRPTLSLDENSFLRGVAVELGAWKLALSAFYSNHQRDANILQKDSISGTAESVSSLSEGGYHRLPSEIDDKNAIREQITGANLGFRIHRLYLGITGVYTNWSANLKPVQELYSIYSFTGKTNLITGFDFQFHFRNLYFFGEISMSLNGGTAWLGGLQMSPSNDVRLSLLYRNYKTNYQNPFSSAIGQNGSNSNEQGFLLNFYFRAFPKITITGLIDLFRFPWLKYRTDFLSNGVEFTTRADYQITRDTRIQLKYRQLSTRINTGAQQLIHKWCSQRTQSGQLLISWKVNATLDGSNRIGFNLFSNEEIKPSYGYFISQDLIYHPSNLPLSMTFRIALFQTDSYNVRFYIYENDAPFSATVPALEGTGTRCFLLIHWRPLKWFDLWVRYAHTLYTDRSIISSGLDQINGNMRTDISLQLQFRF
ncbi:MAG: hypothetical protein WCL00_09205 [Bacteroidota bacterium]